MNNQSSQPLPYQVADFVTFAGLGVLAPVVKFLDQYNDAVDLVDWGRQGQTALANAARFGYRDIVDLLLKRGAAIDAKGYEGKTALIVVAAGGSGEMLEYLLQKGAVLDEKDDRGYTALMWAVRCENKDAVRLLLQKGASTVIKNNDGDTPIMIAKIYDKTKMAALLEWAEFSPALKRDIPRSRPFKLSQPKQQGMKP